MNMNTAFKLKSTLAIALGVLAATGAQAETRTAIFGGGCFWCVESDFDKVPGVLKTISGYAGGQYKDPDYKVVSAGRTDHTEAVEVTYDDTKVSYSQLVEFFWKTIDPTVKDRQFCDAGTQYRTGFYYLNDEQKKVAEASKAKLQASGKFKTIHTEVAPAVKFYPAEEYHQDYYKKNPIRYGYYRNGCGRDKRLEELWGTK
jgi:peptide-methionine (S)-S-oxide reductase